MVEAVKQVPIAMTENTGYGLVIGAPEHFYQDGGQITPIMIDYRNGLDSNLYEIRPRSNPWNPCVAVVHGRTGDNQAIFLRRICLDGSSASILFIVSRSDFEKNQDPLYEISDITKELLGPHEIRELGSQRLRVRDFGQAKEDKNRVRKILDRRTHKYFSPFSY